MSSSDSFNFRPYSILDIFGELLSIIDASPVKIQSIEVWSNLDNETSALEDGKTLPRSISLRLPLDIPVAA